MSWLCSRALVAACSQATGSAGESSALSRLTPTPQAYLSPDRTTDFSRPSRFGMTFAPLTDDLGAAVLTWCLAASLARTSARSEAAPASTAPAPASGASSRVSWARFDPASSSWRTAQRSLFADSDDSSLTWPASGIAAGGECWELPMSAPRTSATGSGSSRTSKAGPRFPTPIARDYRSGKASAATMAKNCRPLSEHVGGLLNPTWVEWLMGFPPGWSGFEPLETDKYPPALSKRGGR